MITILLYYIIFISIIITIILYSSYSKERTNVAGSPRQGASGPDRWRACYCLGGKHRAAADVRAHPARWLLYGATLGV